MHAAGPQIGPAYVLRRERMVIPERRIEPHEIDAELARLRAAFAETRMRLEQVRAGMKDTGLVGDVFDDAATGQGLLNYFLRAINCGAITESEAVNLSGLTLPELRSASFVKILKNRQAL